jgi:PXPV repeat-containing protein
MKRIVTHLLVAAGLAAGACGVAQAHSDLSIGLSVGTPAPAYVQPAPVYAAPRPVYYPRWDRGWDHHDWNRGDDHRWEYRDHDHRGWDRGGRPGGNWRE